MGMRVRIANCGKRELTVQSSGRASRSLLPLSIGAKLAREYVEFDMGDNEILFLRVQEGKPATVRLANCGDRDLLVQHNNDGHCALSPLGFGSKVARRYNEFELKEHATLVLRPRGARDNDGVLIRSPV